MYVEEETTIKYCAYDADEKGVGGLPAFIKHLLVVGTAQIHKGDYVQVDGQIWEVTAVLLTPEQPDGILRPSLYISRVTGNLF
jgi:hypothetical protein